uniref:Uncharacterized protein n=1 Tax=Anguilla anguilla TaxID=7936 RepID=A0A0E9XLG3_ANGAN
MSPQLGYLQATVIQ